MFSSDTLSGCPPGPFPPRVIRLWDRTGGFVGNEVTVPGLSDEAISSISG